jgi:ketosteroid isomerase-like protein
MMSRTPQEVFDSHQEALEKGDFQQLAADCAEDAVMLTMDGAFVGREAIVEGFFKAMLGQYPDAKIAFEKTAVEGDLLMLEWSADASAASIPRGVAAYTIRDGLIQRHAEWYEIVAK